MKLSYLIERNRQKGKKTILLDAYELGRSIYASNAPQDHIDSGGELLYDIAKHIANRVLPCDWDDLPDVNSLWTAIECVDKQTSLEEFIDSVQELVKERLVKFSPFDF